VLSPPDSKPWAQLSSCLQICSNFTAFHPAVGVKLLLNLFHPIPGSCNSHPAEDSETRGKIPRSDSTQTRAAGCSLPKSRDGGWKPSKHPEALGASELAKCAPSFDPHLRGASAHRCCLINALEGSRGLIGAVANCTPCSLTRFQLVPLGRQGWRPPRSGRTPAEGQRDGNQPSLG